MDIAKIDKNFAVESSFTEVVKFYDAESEPFKIYGIYREGERFTRMPSDVAKTVNNGVKRLIYNTAGGRVRFVTDSANVAIKAKMNNAVIMPHMSLAGSAGFDLYEYDSELGETYVATYRPPIEVTKTNSFDGIARLGSKKMRELTIHFPTYSGVDKLYIGLDPDATVEEPKPYKNEKPVVYYGSSITQGGCVSKPGDTYQEIISRRFGLDYINLGFSGSAKGEDTIAEYISGLDMSIFVYDYDHNAPNPEHLAATHEKMFLAIREKNPKLPIIMMSRPRYVQTTDTKKRLEVITKTYENAKAHGDGNVYLISGRELMAICKNEGSVDGTHPTSLGFFSMAKAVGDVIEKILEKNPEIIRK